MTGKNSRPPSWLLKMCGHGKPLDEECMACAIMFRIEERKDAEIVRLRARVQELEAQVGT